MEHHGPPLQGLRHLALRVTDIEKVKQFYLKLFGMRVVWEPDPQNCYLTSGTDNLALHAVEPTKDIKREEASLMSLDHFGFIAETPQVVDAWAAWAAENAATILKGPTRHRDGSYSCYVADPEGNTIQILYEPRISAGSLGDPRSRDSSLRS